MAAKPQLDCRRLRHRLRRLEELQTLPLAQRVAIKLQQPLRLADVVQGRLVLDSTDR